MENVRHSWILVVFFLELLFLTEDGPSATSNTVGEFLKKVNRF